MNKEEKLAKILMAIVNAIEDGQIDLRHIKKLIILYREHEQQRNTKE